MHADIRSRSLDQYIAKIRDAYADHGRSLECLRTIHGIGYWYEPATGNGGDKSGKKPRRA